MVCSEFKGSIVNVNYYYYYIPVGNPLNAWFRDQPNNYDDYQGCMALNDFNSYKWGDEDCSDFQDMYYLCGYGEY